MHRSTLVLNPIEPGPLNLRHAVGLSLDLLLALRDQSGAPVDPETLRPILTLMPRSLGGVHTYAMETYDAGNGLVRATIPAEVFRDRAGYTIELYSRIDFSAEEPVPGELLALGCMAMTGAAYGYQGPRGIEEEDGGGGGFAPAGDG